MLRPRLSSRFLARRYGNPHRQRGALVVVFVMFLVLVSVAAGAAMDFGRAFFLRSRLQEIADNANLAANAYAQNRSTATLTTIANNYLAANGVAPGLATVTITESTYDAPNFSYSLKLRGVMPTSFLRLAGIRTLTINVSAGSTRKPGPLELVLALDASISMFQGISVSDTTVRKTALQNATTAMIDTVASSNVRIAIVPFAAAVKVGTGYSTARWIDSAGLVRLAQNLQVWNGCTGNRIVDDQQDYAAATYPAVFVDARADIPDYAIGVPYPAKRKYPIPKDQLICGYTSVNDPTGGAIMDLTSTDSLANVAALKKKVSAVGGDTSTSGGTGASYLPSGLLWAWNVLTPNDPFVSASTKEQAQQLGIRKVILILTDGGNNLKTVTNGAVWTKGANADYSDVDTLQDNICTNIKNDGIEIYTVAFAAPGQATETTMKSCATSPLTYFAPTNATQLTNAFLDIAAAIMPLKLTQ